MLTADHRKPSRLAIGLLVCLSFLVFVSSTPSAWGQSVGHVIGRIDGISHDGDQYFITGWACQQGRSESIQIHVYADHSAYGTPRGNLIVVGWANFYSEPEVNRLCQDGSGGQHRFLIALPAGSERRAEQGKLYLHGIRIVNGVANDAIAGSAEPLRALPTTVMPFATATVPTLAGAYRHLPAHPRVFVTAAELKDLASRINRPTSYSKQRFAGLANQIKRDLAANTDWDATYAGCDIDIYLRAFSYEPRGGYPTEIRTEEQLNAAMQVRPGASAPAGAAVVAARLALYAALAKSGAVIPPGGPSGDAAAALAKRIVLAWAARGFRDARGDFLPLSAFRCEDKAKPAPDLKNTAGTDIPLQLGRGIVYSVHAQDLLQSLGVLNDQEQGLADRFHAAMFDMIRRSGSKALGNPHPACERFANGGAVALASLLAVARLLDDERHFTAVLNGGDPAAPVLIPWTRFFDGVIYGEDDHPMPCYPNTGPDGLHSGGAFTTATVAPGEIQDRYRAGVLQTFGYAMASLQWLFDAAEILRIAGFQPYAYRGTHGQSIETAVRYYACYGKTPGFYATVTRENARACQNFEQYYGKVVNGVDASLLYGSYRFPDDPAVTALDDAAKARASSGAFAEDAILFGKWRD